MNGGTMTRGTLLLLRQVLASQQLSAGDPDLVATATAVATALAEIDTALAEEA